MQTQKIWIIRPPGGGGGGGGVGGTQMRKSGKKGATSFCANGLFHRFIDLNKRDPASENQSHLERRSLLVNPPHRRRQDHVIGAGVSEDVSGLSAQLVAASAKNTSAVWCQRTKANTRGSAASSRYPPPRPCKLCPQPPLPGFGGDLGEVLSAPQKEG